MVLYQPCISSQPSYILRRKRKKMEIKETKKYIYSRGGEDLNETVLREVSYAVPRRESSYRYRVRQSKV